MTTAQRDAFAAEVRAVILQMHPAATVEPLPGEFGFIVHREADARFEQRMVLDNVFHETRDMEAGSRRRAIVRMVRTLSILDEPVGDWEKVQPRLVPLLRASALGLGPGRGNGGEPIRRPFAPNLIECVGIDADAGIMYVGPELVAMWGVSVDDVFAAAHRTAAEAFLQAHVSLYDETVPYPIWIVSRPDSYESSRLVMPGWLASFEGRVTGRPVAIVPSREVLIVGGDGDERCLRRLIEVARGEFKTSTRSISTGLYTTGDGGAVVPLVLPKSHPLVHEVALGHIQLAMAEYGRQKQELAETKKEDIFVASLQGMTRPDGSVFSFAQWSCGVPTLLPRADMIVMLLSSRADRLTVHDIICVPWADVLDIVGDCLVREPGLDPPRWRTRRWPDDSKVARLRKAALPLGIENSAPSVLH